jgi:hypothetical protein
MSSSSGNASARGAGHLVGLMGPIGIVGIGAGMGNMMVDVYVVAGGGEPPKYLGRFKGSSFGTLNNESIAAGESVGHQIASRVSE